MSKTITLRVDEHTYNLVKKAADGDRRTISNFVEFATVNYLTSNYYVSDEEMDEILDDKALLRDLKKGEDEIKKGKFKIVK